MKMTWMAFFAVLCLFWCVRADSLGAETSDSAAIDLTVGPVTYALSDAQTVSVDYGSLYGDVESGTAQFFVNGAVKASGGTASTFDWKPTAAGTYALEHRMLKNGEVIGTTLSVTHVVTAPFGSAYVGVAVSDECEGMGTVSGGNKSFKAGAKVALKATAKKGYVFAGWYLDDAIGTIASTCVSQAASYSYTVGEDDVTLYAKFIATGDDWVSVDCAAEEEYAKGETMAPIEIVVDSGSLATVKVTGLPTGLKFTAKALSVKATKTTDAAEYAANTIYGTPTKSGVYTATVTATTASKATATKALKFIVRGEGECIVDADVVLVDAIGTIASTEAVPGKVTGMGVYAAGKKVTLKATANKGYVFMG